MEGLSHNPELDHIESIESGFDYRRFREEDETRRKKKILKNLDLNPDEKEALMALSLKKVQDYAARRPEELRQLLVAIEQPKPKIDSSAPDNSPKAISERNRRSAGAQRFNAAIRQHHDNASTINRENYGQRAVGRDREVDDEEYKN